MILLSPEYKKHLKSFIRQVRKEAQLEILEEVEKETKFTIPELKKHLRTLERKSLFVVTGKELLESLKKYEKNLVEKRN